MALKLTTTKERKARLAAYESLKRTCAQCDTKFIGKSFEHLCPACEGARRARDYTTTASADAGWVPIGDGGHVRRTMHHD